MKSQKSKKSQTRRSSFGLLSPSYQTEVKFGTQADRRPSWTRVLNDKDRRKRPMSGCLLILVLVLVVFPLVVTRWRLTFHYQDAQSFAKGAAYGMDSKVVNRGWDQNPRGLFGAVFKLDDNAGQKDEVGGSGGRQEARTREGGGGTAVMSNGDLADEGGVKALRKGEPVEDEIGLEEVKDGEELGLGLPEGGGSYDGNTEEEVGKRGKGRGGEWQAGQGDGESGSQNVQVHGGGKKHKAGNEMEEREDEGGNKQGKGEEGKEQSEQPELVRNSGEEREAWKRIENSEILTTTRAVERRADELEEGDSDMALSNGSDEAEMGVVLDEAIETVLLDFNLTTEKMERVLMHTTYFWQNVSRAHPCNESLLCPHFTKCKHSKSVAVGVCRNPELVNGKIIGKPPLNFLPSKKYRRGQTMAPFTGNVYMLENMYLDIKGRVFNKTHVFILGGCFSFSEDAFFPETTELTKFKVLANLVTWSGQNFYHTITETLPDLLLLEEVIKQYPRIPIAIKEHQERGPFGRLAPGLGFNLSSLNLVSLRDRTKDNTARVDTLFFAERLLVPAHQFCGKPSGAVVHKLRERFGIRTLEGSQPNLTLWERAQTSLVNWTVVFGRRPHGLHRSIIGQDDLLTMLEGLYGTDRVSSFWGNITVSETRDLFSRAAMYIGPHGAGMTNVIFMPSGAAVLEVMPRDLVNPCYHFLSDRCDLDYYLVYGKGNWSTPIEVELKEVTDLATRILPPDKTGQVH